MVISSLEEFSTVCCDLHSQKLYRSQWSRSRWFSGIPLLFQRSTGCWQFDVWFLCLFKIQLEHLEVLGSRTVEAYWKDFEHCFASIWNECGYVVVWTFFSIALLWDWNENWPFPVLWPLLSFPNLLAYWMPAVSQHHLLGFEIAQLEFHHLH